jgi:hypothetical protein
MSHFAVLVVGENPEDQLAPYIEQLENDESKKYFVFDDKEDEFREEFETEKVEMVQMPDGRRLHTWDDEFQVKGTFGMGTDTHKVPDTYSKVMVPLKQIYKTFDNFMKLWHGFDGPDKETGRYGYWSNPNRKWDWYELGGRWTGFFKAKPGVIGTTGRPGLMTPDAESGWYDQLTKEEIDFDFMRADAEKKAAEQFDKVMEVIGDRKKPTTWKSLLKKYGMKRIEEARKEYNENPVIKDLQKAQLMPFMDDLKTTYAGFNRKKYIQQRSDESFQTFAVVYNGKWYERGEMGWWGCVSNEKPKSDWNKEFTKLLSELPDDTLLSVYDCHI